MQKDNTVSLWLGNFNSNEDLINFTDIDYTDDGDLIPSLFQKKFEIEEYDTDFIEIDYKEIKSNDLNILLKGASYDYEIIDQFIKKNKSNKEYNTVILIYNFQYNGKINNIKLKDNEIKFIGIAFHKK